VPPVSTTSRGYKRCAQGQGRLPFCFFLAMPLHCSPAPLSTIAGFLRVLTIDCHRMCTSDSTTTLRRTARACNRPMSTPSPSATSRPHRHRSPSSTRAHCHCQPTLVSPRFLQCLPSVPRGLGVPHGSTFPTDSPPAGRNRPAEPRRRRGESIPCFGSWAGVLPSQVG
jgi:hypothetical protein